MKRVRTIDYLKTLSIIGVLLFHVGAIQNGYLGVEVFYVITGYLMIQGIKKNIENGEYKPISYIIKRVAQFWPLVAISGVLVIVIGYFCMLPDDFENLAESVIASDFFSNNILQAITTKNYWDVVNTYKPLMHTWYVGVLVQSVVFLSFVFWVASKISKKNGLKLSLIIVTALSFIVYCLPFFSESDKFYYFPFRLFEITIGCLIPYFPKTRIKPKTMALLGNIGIGLVFFMLFSWFSIPGRVGLITVLLTTAVILWCRSNIEEEKRINEKVYKVISSPGRYSYDVYIWHQVIIALLYYSAFQSLNVLLIVLVIVLTTVLSVISAIIRKKAKLLNGVWKRIIISIFFVIIGCSLSGYIYIHAGVMRDVPELGIDKDNVHRNMHAEYVDIPYSWNVDFCDDNKIHILVLGDSFGRDFANVLNESSYSEQLEISYISGLDVSQEQERVSRADFVFYGSSNWSIPSELDSIPSEKLYIIGNKSFGNSNGIIYINRNKDYYYDQRVELPDDMFLNNNTLRSVYGDHYIDMIGPLTNKDGMIRVFTDDNYYISQDCKHLTKQGAKYYSKILDLGFLTK